MKKISGKVISNREGIFEIEPESPIENIEDYEVYFVKK